MLTRTSLLIQQLVDSGAVRVDLAAGVITGLRGRPLKPRLDRSGYATVSLARNHLPVHRIVAYAAFGERALQAGMVITHIDGNRANNAAANLRVQPAARPARAQRARLGWGVGFAGELRAAFATRELAEEYAAWKYGPAAEILSVR
jgi:hypothetical protein